MERSHDTEDSWEVLSRTDSDSSIDSRTPVALHFPIALAERSASLQHPPALESPRNVVRLPQRKSLDKGTPAPRSRATGRRFRQRTISQERESLEKDDVGIESYTDGGSSSSSESLVDLQQPDLPLQPTEPPQQYHGVLAGDSWCSLSAPSAAAAPQPITLVFAGVPGSGKSSTCRSFADGSETGTLTDPASLPDDSGVASSVVLEGRTVTLVDTPGLGQPGAEATVLAALREKSLQGAHVALVLTVSICAPFDEHQAEALSSVLAAGGAGAATHAVVAFTCGDAPHADWAFLPNYLEEASPALQELSQKVDGRVTVIANNPIAAAENGSSTRSQVSRVLQLASSVAAQGTSAPWAHTSNAHREIGSGKEVSRLRKVVVYSLAACGMMGLHVLTSGSNGFNKKRDTCKRPGVLLWHLNECDTELTDGYTDSGTDGFTDGFIDGCTGGCTDGFTDGFTNGFTNGGTDGNCTCTCACAPATGATSY